MEATMTEGERMVWALVFARRLDDAIHHPPPGVCLDPKRWQEYEDNVTHQAVEAAAGAVERMRGVLPGTVEGWGADSPITAMLRAMLEK